MVTTSSTSVAVHVMEELLVEGIENRGRDCPSRCKGTRLRRGARVVLTTDLVADVYFLLKE